MAFLFPAYVSIWNSKKPGKRIGLAYGDYFFLNTNRVIELRPLNVDETKFYYANDPDDARDSPDYIECDMSKAGLEAYHNMSPASKFVTLPMFPHLNRTGTPVNTMIEWKDIAYVYVTRDEYFADVCHLIYYEKAWKRKEVIVNLAILAVFMLQY